MSTHDPGKVYLDWRKMEAAETALHAELAHDQVSHPMSQYQPGSLHLERLWEQIEAARKWQWPAQFTMNV